MEQDQWVRDQLEDRIRVKVGDREASAEEWEQELPDPEENVNARAVVMNKLTSQGFPVPR